jgi:hypothetical protein
MKRASSRPAVFALALAAAPLSPAASAEVPGAVVVLEAPHATPGSDPAVAPLARLVLLEDGQVFVGGTDRYDTAQLDKSEQQPLRRSAEAIRKSAGKSGQLSLGGDSRATTRLRLPGDEAEVAISGDPAAAPATLAPAAAALVQLLRFDHPGLRPYKPVSYALSVREQSLVGGCRAWAFSASLEQARSAPVTVPAAEADGWPTGSWPASVCAGDKRYSVTLRPLLPGEQP